MDETQKSIDDLQNQIDKAEVEVEDEKHQRLDAIKKSIHLYNTNPDEKNRRSLKEQLEEAMLHFDVEHHQLVLAMENAINTLSNSGV